MQANPGSTLESPHRAFDVAPRAPLRSAPLVDFSLVKADIVKMLHESQPFWPADVFGGKPHYGPFLVRQAWHCAGSYRTSDGRGGCDGGRQRFEPERSWDDNTNLDKAKKLLYPIKQKYGDGLSWGDLIIYASNVAIEDMGGPVLGFCAGRVDDADGSDSLLLGPTDEQKKYFPCAVDGDCKAPLGATTLGLIYVNPEGPQGNPVPELSAPQVRDTFGRMAMNDSETVALIGGGHAFGKTHGACVLPDKTKFPAPKDDPANPWPKSPCPANPDGVVTSGFDGAWTRTPSKWTNDYFKNLLAGNWTVGVGIGGHNQWKVDAFGPLGGLMMLTSDISLTRDPKYKAIVQKFAATTPGSSSNADLDWAFANAWYKLTTRDMGPYSRCLQAPGTTLPPPQAFQYPLPAPASQQPDWEAVRAQVKSVIRSKQAALKPDTDAQGADYYGAVFVELAWQCASTVRREFWFDIKCLIMSHSIFNFILFFVFFNVTLIF